MCERWSNVSCDNSKTWAAQRSVQFVFDCPQERMPAWGDADRLARGLAQVVDNAIKFTPSGGVVGVRVLHSGSTYRITIADNGPGIPPSQIAKVLEPFVQADGSPTRKHQGVGIGLAIARRVAEGLGANSLSRLPPMNESGESRFAVQPAPSSLPNALHSSPEGPPQTKLRVPWPTASKPDYNRHSMPTLPRRAARESAPDPSACSSREKGSRTWMKCLLKCLPNRCCIHGKVDPNPLTWKSFSLSLSG